MRQVSISYLISQCVLLFGCGPTLVKNVDASRVQATPPLRGGIVRTLVPRNSYPVSSQVVKADRRVSMHPPKVKLSRPQIDYGSIPFTGPNVPAYNYSRVLMELTQKVDLLRPVHEGDELYIAKKYFDEYVKLLRNLAEAEKKPHRDIDPQCPPRNLTISWKGKIYAFARGDFIAKGSSSRVYRSPRVGDLGTLVTKSLGPLQDEETGTLNPDKTLRPGTKLSLLQDEAFMLAFNDARNLVPHTYHIEPKGMDAYCNARTIVSEDVGATELEQLRLPVDKNSRARLLYKIGSAALRIIKQIHQTGLIHGDIHFRNWLVQDLKRPAETLRLIDFGRVELFMIPNKTNPHRAILIPDVDNPQIPTRLSLNAYHLSPWEMQGHRLTRRDDVFRIAEMLVRLYGEDSGFMDKYNDAKKKREDARRRKDPAATQAYLTGVLRLKQERPFNPDLPELLKEFYQYSLGLEYDQEPNYDHWIGIFENAAAT